jgi:hypothetical protein
MTAAEFLARVRAEEAPDPAWPDSWKALWFAEKGDGNRASFAIARAQGRARATVRIRRYLAAQGGRRPSLAGGEITSFHGAGTTAMPCLRMAIPPVMS